MSTSKNSLALIIIMSIKVISYERGKQLADSLGLDFFETSAKENINVRVRCPFEPSSPSSRI